MSSSYVSSRLPSVFTMPKVVRDLLWTVTSPHMLSGDRFPVLPSKFGLEALKFDSVIDWLNALVADPTPLLTFLQETTSNGRSLALGVYFSTLLEYWLRFCPYLGVEKMDIGKQIVSSTNRTVGQLKFLFRCNFPTVEEVDEKQRDFHVESSVKFFLLNPMENEAAEVFVENGAGNDVSTEKNVFVPLEHYVGPHLGENLAWRVQEVERKLAMRRGESVRAWLQENYSDMVQSHIVLRGYLFQPLRHFASTSETTIAHDWYFHQSPRKLAKDDAKESSNPSIAVDHLRGWWTNDMETDLPAKVKANDNAALGESRFVILPKLHWLSPLVAVEDKVSGLVTVVGDERLDIPHVEALALEELMAFVRDHFQEVASSADMNKTGGVAMPLLVAEIVRCTESAVDSAGRRVQCWYELSRGFILDPKCWDPSPLCHEPVRFRRTLRRNTTNGVGQREYEVRADWGGEGFIKPDMDEVAAQDLQKRHEYKDPASVGPQELGEELASLLGAERELFTHADLKRSTKELLLWKREHSTSMDNGSTCTQRTAESAFLRSCLESLILGAESDDESKLARRAGYMLLDVFNGLNRETMSDEPDKHSSEECSNWVNLVTEVAHDSSRWEFLNLVLRAMGVTVSGWGIVVQSSKISFLDNLLAAHSTRWNGVVVEVIRIFRLGEAQQQIKLAEDSQKVRAIFDEFVNQCDWQNAERLAIVTQSHEIMQTLFKHLSLLNMTKALKRLQEIAGGDQSSQPDFLSARSDDSVGTEEIDPTSLGHPIDHAKNRSLNEKHALEFRWKYADSSEDIDEVVHHLRKSDSAVRDENEIDDQAATRNILVGIDCEWRPQFLVKEQSSQLNIRHAAHDQAEKVASDDEPSNQIGEDQDGLSIYQLAVGDTVYVIDVQVLGAAAAAPLNFIWRPSSRLMLIGFCVSSDIQRIRTSFPELEVLSDRRNNDTNLNRSTPLLLELKELALFRHVPAKNWGLSRLYRACIGDEVDKEQQCSDWGSRPLSTSQLEYAAKDAYAVQRLAWHLLADIDFACSENGSTYDCAVNFLKRFDAVNSFSHSWTLASASQPLGKQHVKAALQALGVQTRFLRSDAGEKEGLLVKSIALLIRREKEVNTLRRLSYAVAVLPLDRSIDMQALGTQLGVDPGDISLADQETLVRVFGYSRGCLGPVGLREQQAMRIILDDCLKSETFLLCGAGVLDEVYAIAPTTLMTAVNALVATISR